MPKLIDYSDSRAEPIGNDGLLQFIDELNDMRRLSGNRFRYEPFQKDENVLGMREHYAFPRPARPDTPSPRYAGPRLAAVRD